MPLSNARRKVAKVSLPKHIPVGQKPPQYDEASLYLNRELSWLEFNARVLAEAGSAQVPLYERLKFLSIFSSNLDEFFMVRVAGLQAQILSSVIEPTADGRTAEQQLLAVSERAHELCTEQARIWREELQPALLREGIAVVAPAELAPAELAQLDQRFERDIFPVLTPIAIDPAHPFPHLRNKAINVGFVLERDNVTEPRFGLVQLPASLPRLLPTTLGGARRAYITLEELIFRNAQRLFPNQSTVDHFSFRVTRNFDIELDEDEGEDLMLTIQAELRRRERGHAVRLEISGTSAAESLDWLCAEHELQAVRDVYLIDAPLMLDAFQRVTSGDERTDLRDPAFSPVYVPPLRDSEDFFATIREKDVLLHHPYESFEAVIDFIGQAAEDPNVLAIKQTLYRTGGESPMVRALQRAAELGKEVTAVVELKARFDEASNIQWARTLERSGVNVMYGLLGFKTHAKVLMVVRKEGDQLRRYVHLATGNYNQTTARIYEDLSLFTARDDVGEDATSLFNLLTGYSAPAKWNHLLISPLGLHEAILGLIHREVAHARAGKPARIVAKMNSLVDPDVITTLYAASREGVQIDLLIRGICCLRPGVPGVSDNIRVHALIDRFLEHARILYFENGGEFELYCGSADWMPRNFRRRVEVVFPLVDPDTRARVRDEILATMQSDNVKAWRLGPDGHYERITPAPDAPPQRSQETFVNLARARARVGGPTLKARSLRSLPSQGPSLEKLRRSRRGTD